MAYILVTIAFFTGASLRRFETAQEIQWRRESWDWRFLNPIFFNFGYVHRETNTAPRAWYLISRYICRCASQNQNTLQFLKS